MMRNATIILRSLAGPAILLCLLANCAGEKQVEYVGTELGQIPSLGVSTVNPAEIPSDEEVALALSLMDSSFNMLGDLNDDVRKWVRFFSAGSLSIRGSLERGQVYRDVVQDILASQGVPREFYYLPMIESGYLTHAISRRGAVGFWQFTRPTAKRYGLKCNDYVDERRDVIRATRAAAKYLSDLHRSLRSWNLVLAAYNAGANRIARAIRRGKSRNFWVLAQKGVMPVETLHFVPKFFAAVLVGMNPARYGFPAPTLGSGKHFPPVTGVAFPPLVSFEKMVEKAHVPVAELRWLNPHLLQGMTPPNTRSYQVWVPKATAVALAAAWDRLIIMD